MRIRQRKTGESEFILSPPPASRTSPESPNTFSRPSPPYGEEKTPLKSPPKSSPKPPHGAKKAAVAGSQAPLKDGLLSSSPDSANSAQPPSACASPDLQTLEVNPRSEMSLKPVVPISDYPTTPVKAASVTAPGLVSGDSTTVDSSLPMVPLSTTSSTPSLAAGSNTAPVKAAMAAAPGPAITSQAHGTSSGCSRKRSERKRSRAKAAEALWKEKSQPPVVPPPASAPAEPPADLPVESPADPNVSDTSRIKLHRG
ncbi:hypothetical protein DY000_02024137 [Brassica cretica]|uniref:Uncharacterized protein n=1 Tax=Brassica cretica TaxID=69181 RepID=A0ABQ7E3X7_BRACR|nr:hypothetical protein DY000_02024137 [Brassica cretica]